MLNYLLLVKGIASRLKAVVNDATSLLDFYYSIGSLVLIKVTYAQLFRRHFSTFILLVSL
jgi:hypothetical protein